MRSASRRRLPCKLKIDGVMQCLRCIWVEAFVVSGRFPQVAKFGGHHLFVGNILGQQADVPGELIHGCNLIRRHIGAVKRRIATDQVCDHFRFGRGKELFRDGRGAGGVGGEGALRAGDGTNRSPCQCRVFLY